MENPVHQNGWWLGVPPWRAGNLQGLVKTRGKKPGAKGAGPASALPDPPPAVEKQRIKKFNARHFWELEKNDVQTILWLNMGDQLCSRCFPQKSNSVVAKIEWATHGKRLGSSTSSNIRIDGPPTDYFDYMNYIDCQGVNKTIGMWMGHETVRSKSPGSLGSVGFAAIPSHHHLWCYKPSPMYPNGRSMLFVAAKVSCIRMHKRQFLQMLGLSRPTQFWRFTWSTTF